MWWLLVWVLLQVAFEVRSEWWWAAYLASHSEKCVLLSEQCGVRTDHPRGTLAPWVHLSTTPLCLASTQSIASSIISIGLSLGSMLSALTEEQVLQNMQPSISAHHTLLAMSEKAFSTNIRSWKRP